MAADPVAVLYQAVTPPPVDGITKPMKPGGYSDSGADIAFNLREAGVPVVVPNGEPDPAEALQWVFPDTSRGIASALDLGARVLWLNTVLFATHPVARLARPGVRFVGQSPAAVERYDDKYQTNIMLGTLGCPVARAILVGLHEAPGVVSIERLDEAALRVHGIEAPYVVKPVRGRGSEGVRVVENLPDLAEHAMMLLTATYSNDGPRLPCFGERVIVEEFLPGAEITVTLMPAGTYLIDDDLRSCSRPWPLPPVERLNHECGIAPYSGVVAVTRNSVILDRDRCQQVATHALLAQCVTAGEGVFSRAPIRIDCRIARDGDWRMFDLNMKPNMTGPGRPGRQDQDSLTSIAARGIGWTYRDLLLNMLNQAWPAGAAATVRSE